MDVRAARCPRCGSRPLETLALKTNIREKGNENRKGKQRRKWENPAMTKQLKNAIQIKPPKKTMLNNKIKEKQPKSAACVDIGYIK